MVGYFVAQIIETKQRSKTMSATRWFIGLFLATLLIAGCGGGGGGSAGGGGLTPPTPPSGSLDTSFDGDGKVTTPIGSGDDVANAIAIQGDGKIVVAGYSSNGTNLDFTIVRYNTDGLLDTSFGSGGKVTTDFGNDDAAYAMAIQGDGKIVVAGYSSNGTNLDFTIVRYNTDGSLDTSFDGDGKVTTDIGIGSYDFANTIAIQGDGKIVVAGYSSNGSNNDFAIVRYNTDGSLDTSFGSDGKVTTPIGSGDDEAYAIAIQGDGKIVVAGYSSNGSNNDFAIVRYNADGSLDTSFGTGGKVTTDFGGDDAAAYAIAIQGDGKIVVAGYSWNGSNNDFAIARYWP